MYPASEARFEILRTSTVNPQTSWTTTMPGNGRRASSGSQMSVSSGPAVIGIRVVGISGCGAEGVRRAMARCPPVPRTRDRSDRRTVPEQKREIALLAWSASNKPARPQFHAEMTSIAGWISLVDDSYGKQQRMTAVSDIEYSADGRQMQGRLALPDGDGPCPAVLIAHEGPGLEDHQRERAEELARRGYASFALDYHGGGTVITDREAMMHRLDELWQDAPRCRDVTRAGLGVLLDQPRVDPHRLAAIGYCFGGHLVLELARGGAELAAVVGFHPRLATPRPRDAANITGKVLVCLGSEDPVVSAGERLMFEEQMREGGVDWQAIVYGGAQHSFTHPKVDSIDIRGFGFDERSTRRSWNAMLDLLNETLW